MIMKNHYSLDKSAKHDLAVQIAFERFEQMHPKEKQPTWLKYCMALNITQNRNQNWVIKMILRPKYKLPPNMYWVWQDNGIPILVEVNPDNGEKSVIICCGPPVDDLVFFEVEVDAANNLTKIQVDCDPNTLNGDHYEINTR